jgi:hypothetical protein
MCRIMSICLPWYTKRHNSYMKRSEQSDSAVILSALMYAAGLNPDDPLREENQKD